MYNFRFARCVLRFTEHSTNFPSFPKFAVSPESLGTGQTALGAARWFPCSAFLEVASAGPSSGLRAVHLPARGASTAPSLPTAQRHREPAKRPSRFRPAALPFPRTRPQSAAVLRCGHPVVRQREAHRPLHLPRARGHARGPPAPGPCA